MQCPQCQHENPAGAKFCNQCATPLLLQCSACATENPPGARFCHQCATPLATLSSTPDAPQPEMLARFTSPKTYTPRHLAEKILTSRSAMEGERKQVTVLFCDLANSTAMAARCGPDSMHALLNRFFELALDTVYRYEGTINQFLGDGFMALFGAPIAHEDHARHAVLAALDLQRTLHAQHAELGEPHGVRCAFIAALASERSHAHVPLTGCTSIPSFQTCALPLDGTALWPKDMLRLLSVSSTPCLPGKQSKKENPRKELQHD